MSPSETELDTGSLFHELLRGLSAEELAVVEQIARRVEFKAGSEIFRLGEEAQAIFFIDQGQVALTLPLAIRDTTRDVTVEEKGAGSVLAWSALVPPFKLTLSARAASEVSLVGLDRPALETIFEEHPSIHLVAMKNLSRVIAGRLALVEAIVLRNLQRWVTEKFA